MWNSSWHVCNAIESALVNLEGRIGVGGRFRIFEATALIDSYVDQYAAWLHLANHFVGDKFWRFCTWNEHSADNQISFSYRALQLIGVAHDCAKAASIEVIEFAKAIQVSVEHGYFCTHTDCNCNGVCSGNSGTNDGYPSWSGARYARHQHSVAAVLAH